MVLGRKKLPKHWEVKCIGDVCETGAGGTPLKSNREYYEGGTIPWLLSGEVAQGEISESKNFITQSGLDNSSAKIFPVNTVLVAMYGATAGQVGILRFEAATNQAVCGIYPNEKLIPEFIFYAMLSKQTELISKATGNAQPNISQIKVKNTKIPIPPLDEQKRIVAILDEVFEGIDAAIANTEKNLANARELFESYLNTIFTRKGDDWEKKKLKDLVNISHGYAFKGPDFEKSSDLDKPIVLTPGNYSEDGTLYFTSQNTKRLTGQPAPDGYLFDVGDLTIVMTDLSSKMKILGKPAFIEHPNILHNQRIGRIHFQSDSVSPRYVYYFLRTQLFSDSIKATATGTMVRHTAPKRILANEILYPINLDEQSLIITQLDELAMEVQKLESIYQQKLTALNELKQSILQKAFSGELTAEVGDAAVAGAKEVIAA